MKARWGALGVALVALGCGSHAPPPPASGPLPEGVVARVGPREIRGEGVGRTAAAQRIDLQAARDRAVRDALLACGAEERGLDHGLDVEVARRGVLARRLLQGLRDDAAREPITAEELSAAAERRAQRDGIPAALVSPELLERDVLATRAGAAGERLLAGLRGKIERAPDAEALIALVGVDP